MAAKSHRVTDNNGWILQSGSRAHCREFIRGAQRWWKERGMTVDTLYIEEYAGEGDWGVVDTVKGERA